MKITISLNRCYLLLLLLFKEIITSLTYDISQLKLVLVVHRHGDRTPISTYPLDPYRNITNWSDGWGQLTPNGKLRMFKLGKYIRDRYKNYLGISPREVYIRSSAADRCLESVSLVLAGAYPPEQRWQWDNSLGKSWQPFPIQTEPRYLDGMLNPGSVCPSADAELKKIRKSSKVQKYTKKHLSLLKYVADNTGLNVTDIITAEEIYDTVMIEKVNGLKLPLWIDEQTYEALSDISDMTFYFDYSTKLIQRFRTGLLLQEMAKRMKESILPRLNVLDILPNTNFNASYHKIIFYSTHDSQLAVLLNALSIFNMKAPPFGSAIFFELYERNNDHIIQIYYLNVTESRTPYLLTIAGCSDHNNECHLGQFLHYIEEFIPSNWKQECHNDETYRSEKVMTILIGSILTFGVILLFFLSCFYFKQKENTVVYQMLPIKDKSII